MCGLTTHHAGIDVRSVPRLQVYVGRAMLRHRTVGGWIHVLRHRSRWWKHKAAEHGCWLCKSQFAAIAYDNPDHEDEVQRAKADADAGRLYEWNPNGRDRPSSKWSPDDPVQPEGWHHDGSAWVLNEDGGWFQSPSGYWRYTKPGEIGWQEQRDGSWEYNDGPL